MTKEHTTQTSRQSKNTYEVNCTCGFCVAVTTTANRRTGEDFGTTENHALQIAAKHRSTHQ